MANDDPDKPSPFNVATIRNLVALMSRHDLSEIDLREGPVRIRLRRGMAAPAGPVPFAPVLPAAAAPLPPPAPPPADGSTPSRPAAAPAPARNLIEIKSPTPGTFYTSATPGTPPFVKVGSKVTPTTVVCIIEAMKILNEIPADCTGVITEILAENQQPVEYGQVLFRVDPTG